MLKWIIAVLAVFVFLWCSALRAESALGNLIELAKNQGEIQKAYQRETAAYESLKAAIEKGKIKKGQAEGEIKKLYGEAVIILPERGTSREKWYYKRASSSFFDGDRIILYFDKSGILDEISIGKSK